MVRINTTYQECRSRRCWLYPQGHYCAELLPHEQSAQQCNPRVGTIQEVEQFQERFLEDIILSRIHMQPENISSSPSRNNTLHRSYEWERSASPGFSRRYGNFGHWHGVHSTSDPAGGVCSSRGSAQQRKSCPQLYS